MRTITVLAALMTISLPFIDGAAKAEQRDFRDYVNEECRPTLRKTVLFHLDPLRFWVEIKVAIEMERELNAGYEPCQSARNHSERNRCIAAVAFHDNWTTRCYRLARQEIARLRSGR